MIPLKSYLEKTRKKYVVFDQDQDI